MKLLTRLLVFLLFFVVATPAFAMTTRGGETIYIPEDETVQGTLFAGGNTITIDGVVDGDLFCGTQTLVISGTVDGDVICGAQHIRVDGTVTGNLRVGAQSIDIAGLVGRNVTAAGQTLTVAGSGVVTGELIFAGQQVVNNGTVTGDANIYANSFVSGDAATVSGMLNFTQTKEMEAKPVKPKVTFMPPASPWSLVWKVVMYIVLAFIISAVAPKWTTRVLEAMKASPGGMMLKGFLFILVVPIAIVLVCITIIGIPLGVLAALFFALMLCVSRLFVAIWAGQAILKNVLSRKDTMLLSIVIGVPVAWIVFSIPIIGGLVSFFAVLWGVGGMLAARKSKK